jgi:hypothetical protein
MGYSTFRDADLQNSTLSGSFFSRKEAKALVLRSYKTHYPELGEADPGGLGVPPAKLYVNPFLLF